MMPTNIVLALIYFALGTTAEPPYPVSVHLFIKEAVEYAKNNSLIVKKFKVRASDTGKIMTYAPGMADKKKVVNGQIVELQFSDMFRSPMEKYKTFCEILEAQAAEDYKAAVKAHEAAVKAYEVAKASHDALKKSLSEVKVDLDRAIKDHFSASKQKAERHTEDPNAEWLDEETHSPTLRAARTLQDEMAKIESDLRESGIKLEELKAVKIRRKDPAGMI
eukprot:GHVH01015127.1.p1 GENE.GHVH01015127.1~~GHVH01015127.1.p1  ORF type:complete len:220 (+),score=36.93 GHVH01015127.1:51-710(+)